MFLTRKPYLPFHVLQVNNSEILVNTKQVRCLRACSVMLFLCGKQTLLIFRAQDLTQFNSIVRTENPNVHGPTGFKTILCEKYVQLFGI